VKKGVAPAAKRTKTGGCKSYELDKGKGGKRPAKQDRFECERHGCRSWHD